MNRKTAILIALISAVAMTAIFHKQALGLNLLIVETILFIWLLATRQYRFLGRNQVTSGIGLLLTSLFTVLTYSEFSFIINFLALFIFAGILIYPEARSMITSMGISFTNLFNAQVKFMKDLSESEFKGKNLFSYLWRSRIFIIPVFIIVLFMVLYRSANPIFNQLVMDMTSSIQEYLGAIFKDFDQLLVLTFIVCLFLCNLFLMRTSNEQIITSDLNANDELKRIRKKTPDIFNMLALKNEYKAGIFLLFILNALLLLVNSIDIYWVWFNFNWHGQYLKQFVHDGTYLLILSLIISIFLVLYFFRGSINFYKQNTLLKTLGIIWILQNTVLAISVAIRNFRYIEYFSLAYKRIGVIIFLALVLYGLYTVFLKVRQRRSATYLLRTNLYTLYLVLIATSIINWDNLIANYNFKHADRSFLHLEYLSTLSDKSLPELDKSLPELLQLDTVQKKLFPFDGNKPMTPEQYHLLIEDRKKNFIKKWEAKSILSWNLPEYLAYRKLKEKNTTTVAQNSP